MKTYVFKAVVEPGHTGKEALKNPVEAAPLILESLPEHGEPSAGGTADVRVGELTDLLHDGATRALAAGGRQPQGPGSPRGSQCHAS